MNLYFFRKKDFVEVITKRKKYKHVINRACENIPENLKIDYYWFNTFTNYSLSFRLMNIVLTYITVS